MMVHFPRRAAILALFMMVLLPATAALESAAQARVSGARGTVSVTIDISSQRMVVVENGRHIGTWPISSGRGRYRTPRGTYRPYWLSRYHRSRRYNNAWMHWAVFFRGGYAIHATRSIGALGRPASRGCVRLHPSHASRFFNLVRRYGMRNVVIRIRS